MYDTALLKKQWLKLFACFVMTLCCTAMMSQVNYNIRHDTNDDQD